MLEHNWTHFATSDTTCFPYMQDVTSRKVLLRWNFIFSRLWLETSWLRHRVVSLAATTVTTVKTEVADSSETQITTKNLRILRHNQEDRNLNITTAHSYPCASSNVTGRAVETIPGTQLKWESGVSSQALILQILTRQYDWLLTLHITLGGEKTPWSESASELYRPSDCRLSVKWLPTFADRRCHVVSVTDPYGRILGFIDRSRYFSIK
jgi:hypothetical protein